MKRFLICLIVLVVCGVVFDANPQKEFGGGDFIVCLTVGCDNLAIKLLAYSYLSEYIEEISDVTLLNTPDIDHVMDIEEEWHVWVDVRIMEPNSTELVVSGYSFFRVPSIAFSETVLDSMSIVPPVFLPHVRILHVFKKSVLKPYCKSFVNTFDKNFFAMYRERSSGKSP